MIHNLHLFAPLLFLLFKLSLLSVGVSIAASLAKLRAASLPKIRGRQKTDTLVNVRFSALCLDHFFDR